MEILRQPPVLTTEATMRLRRFWNVGHESRASGAKVPPSGGKLRMSTQLRRPPKTRTQLFFLFADRRWPH